MKLDINMSGKWSGTYSQNLSNEEFFEVDFEMELVENDEGFTGICEDLTGTGEKAVIRGFCEETEISFVKRYEQAIYLDMGTNELMIDQENAGPEIHYYGTYNLETAQFVGTWEIALSEEKITADVLNTEIEFGGWVMRKIGG